MAENEMRMIITGGSGFMGTNAVEYFKNAGYSILSIDMKPPQNKKHLPLWTKCDVLDAESLKTIFLDFQPELLLHLAAKTDLKEKNRLNGYAVNIDGVKNMIVAANACNVLKRIIFASSRMVCRIGYQPKNEEDYCPPNLYGQSKVLTEQIVRSSFIKSEWVIVRPTSIWGPWFEIPYRTFFDTINKRLYFHPGKHNPSKTFGFVGNTVYQLDKLLHAYKHLINHKTFYLGDYPPLQLKKWSELIRKEMGLKPIPSIPFPLLRAIALIGDFLALAGWRRVPLTTFRLNNLVADMIYDTAVLKIICGPLPYSLEAGVKLTVKWMKERVIDGNVCK